MNDAVNVENKYFPDFDEIELDDDEDDFIYDVTSNFNIHENQNISNIPNISSLDNFPNFDEFQVNTTFN